MCGIWLLLSKNELKHEDLQAFNNVKNRGPDYTQLVSVNTDKPNLRTLTLGFHRLSIMDLSMNGTQPFVLTDGNRTIYAICNGEIYNYKELRKEFKDDFKKNNIVFNSTSDCEIIPYLYKLYGFNFLMKKLSTAEFAVCIIDYNKDSDEYKFYVGRDHFGVRPLYYGINNDFICFSSELKGIPSLDNTYCEQFEPSTYTSFTHNDLPKIISDKQLINKMSYYNVENHLNTMYNEYITDEDVALEQIRHSFTKAVVSRLESDRPLGALLSGGLDSSLVCSVASQHLAKTGKRLRTFSIGMEDSTDEYYAKKVSEYINSIHTHIELSQDDFVNALDDVIRCVESFDTTTVRATTGQYLISKYICDNYDIKVLLIGDGSDELCSGYMYFHNAPSEWVSHIENIRLLKHIHKYDGQRADRAISGNGLEARVPFLDHKFVDTYLSIHPQLRVPRLCQYNNRVTEKYLLRKAFEGYLPDECLWRPKEAFSDGVSSLKKSWYEIIQERANDIYTDEQFNNFIELYEHYKPTTKEELQFRHIFEGHFSRNVENVVPFRWLPQWSGDIKEPSARVLDVYTS
jgi:asparagine synthase (glutamine-hydrolysing)